MTGGTSRLVMPLIDDNCDASGGVHEGAVLALLDTGWLDRRLCRS